MTDAIDAEAARRVFARLGGETVAVLAKAEASPTEARSAAGATPCSTVATSIRRGTPAPWSAAELRYQEAVPRVVALEGWHVMFRSMTSFSA